MSRLIFQINKGLAKLGYALNPLETPTVKNLRRFLTAYPLANIIDVGANGGQYGSELRHAGYRGKIISCEPLKSPYEKLSARASSDSQWQCLNVALSDHDGTLDLNVSQSTVFSSALSVLPSTIARDGNARVTRVETVTACTLDHIWDELNLSGGSTMLKVDTQGSEQAILNGAQLSLPKLTAVQLELSAEPIYEGQSVMEAMISLLRDQGFVPYMIWPGFCDGVTGRTLEYDGIFVRTR